MSIFRRPRPGGDIGAWCTRCKRDFTHTVLSMASEMVPERVRCNTCGSEHRYLPERTRPAVLRPQSSGGGESPRTISSHSPLPAAERPHPGRTPLYSTQEIAAMDPSDLVEALRDLLTAAGGIEPSRIGTKWEGGTLVFKPGRPGLQEKEIPVDTFFKKIVMVRDRLRVLEQKINTAEKLSDAEKIDMQQYVTRCYGSLTTFNMLFDDRDDWFVGEKKSEG